LFANCCIALAFMCLFAGACSAAEATYHYDALGRLVGADYGSTNMNYSYDAAGNRTSVVTGPNSAPTAIADSATTSSGAVTFDPRFNDTDPDNDPLTITVTGSPTPPTHGAVVINGGTSVTYTANVGYHGADGFSYSITDGHSHNATGTVSVTVP